MLGEYLQKAGQRPFQWGTHDCCTFAADWAMRRGTGDPMIAWRGSYRSEEEAHDLIERAGGLDQLWSLALMGIPEPDEPAIGDIGLVRSVTDDHTPVVGAIFTGVRWAILSERGLLAAPLQPFRVWRP